MTGLDDIVDELETSINEDSGKHIVRHLFDKVSKQQIPLKTELSDDEIKLISALKTIGERCDIPILHLACDEFMKHRISLQRKGRTELIDMGKQIQENKHMNGWTPFGSMPVPGAPR